MTNQIYGRFQQKHDTEANWLKATNFAPLKGEVIIYDADYDAETNPNGYKYPRIKIGIWDGVSAKTSDMMVNNLPFITDGLEEDTVKHISYIDTWAGEVTDLEIIDGEGIKWLDQFDIGMDAGNSHYGDIYHRLPIVSDKGVILNLDEHGLKVQISAPSQISTTYTELKQLRDNSELIPGMFYRITDYECTTVQADTRAMNNKFDIIVQALSSNTLSENASADYHYTFVGGTISSSVIESDNVLVEGAVTPYYYEYIDYTGGDFNEGPMAGYKPMDGFIAYDYLENNDGQMVPVIYKTDIDAIVNDPEFSQPDYQDEFYYVGRETIDGVTYDKWRKICTAVNGDETDLTWYSVGKVYLYTNPIVEGADLPQINGIQPDVANIPAWELKYCLNNDTERFAWASDYAEQTLIFPESTCYDGSTPMIRQPAFDDQEPGGSTEYRYAWGTQADVDDGDHYNFWYSKNEVIENGEEVCNAGDMQIAQVASPGKGVIYYMKDEHSNECPYDFKNIQFQRSTEWQEEHSDFIGSLGLATDDLHWFYTFSYINIENNTAEDLTLKQDLPSDDYSVKYGTHDNSMLPYIQDAINIPRIALNNNIMIYCPEADDGWFYGCYGNNFKNDCYFNTLGGGCCLNTFGADCCNNLFESNSARNTFGNFCQFNIFGTGCQFNTFGNECFSNTFGDECRANTFGDVCRSNALRYMCNSNTFGKNCHSNIFGNYCYSNTFGNDCYSNTFGENCSHNTFGENCSHNTFGSSADSLMAYVTSIRFADSCEHVKLINSESGNDDNYVQNITVSAGVSGTYNSPLELQVSRNAPPVVYEATGTTHIILD